MIVKKISSGRSTAGTANYILGREVESEDDAPEAEGEKEPDKVESFGWSCPRADDIRDVDDAVDAIVREAEEYRIDGGRGSPSSHWVISFEEGEHPSPELINAMMPTFREHQGMPPEAVLIWALHVNTGHVHCHIQASRLMRDESGRLAVRSLGMSEHRGYDPKRNRFRGDDVRSAHKSCAQICRDQGWDAKNLLFGTDLRPVSPKAKPLNDVVLPKIMADAEAHGQASPVRIMGLAAMTELRSSTTWADANSRLSAQGIKLERVPLRNGRGEGGVLIGLDGKTRLKLSSLPVDCSLKNLDRKFDGASNLTPPPASLAGAARILSEAATRRPAKLTPARMRGIVKRFLDVSENWPEFLGKLRAEGNMTLHRTCKTGGVIVAKTQAGDIRIKMSDLGRGTSYLKTAERFQGTLEEVAADIPSELLAEIVAYPQDQPEAVTSHATGQTGKHAAPDPDAMSETEKTTWKLKEKIRRIFKAGLAAYNTQFDAGVVEDPKSGWTFILAEIEKNGFKIEMVGDDAQIVVNSDTKIKLADAEVWFGQYCKTFGEPDIPMAGPEGASSEELEALKTQTQLRRMIRYAESWEWIAEQCDKRGYRLESAETGVQIVIDSNTTVELKSIGISYGRLCDKLGDEPDLPIAGYEQMSEAQRREALELRELKQALAAPTWEEVLKRLDAQGVRLEATGDGNGGRVVLYDGRKVKLSELHGSGGGLAHHRARKMGDLDALLRARKVAAKAAQAHMQATKQAQDKTVQVAQSVRNGQAQAQAKQEQEQRERQEKEKKAKQGKMLDVSPHKRNMHNIMRRINTNNETETSNTLTENDVKTIVELRHYE